MVHEQVLEVGVAVVLAAAVVAVVAVVRAAPATRPGRYTVLDEVDLSDDVLRFAIDEVRD